MYNRSKESLPTYRNCVLEWKVLENSRADTRLIFWEKAVVLATGSWRTFPPALETGSITDGPSRVFSRDKAVVTRTFPRHLYSGLGAHRIYISFFKESSDLRSWSCLRVLVFLKKVVFTVMLTGVAFPMEAAADKTPAGCSEGRIGTCPRTVTFQESPKRWLGTAYRTAAGGMASYLPWV